MLKNIKISLRLNLIVLLTLIGMFAIGGTSLVNLKANLLADRETQIKNIVDGTHKIVTAYKKKAASGELSVEEAKKRAAVAVHEFRYGKTATDYVFIFDDEGLFFAHPRWLSEKHMDAKDANGFEFMRKFHSVARAGGGFVTYYWVRDVDQPSVAKRSFVDYDTEWGWVIGTGVYIDDVDTVFKENLIDLAEIGFVLFVVIALATIMIGRGISKPISTITGEMGRLADGDKNIKVLYTEQKDEIGSLARALLTFKENALRVERLEAEQIENQHKIANERHAVMLKLADEFDETVQGVVSTVSSAAVEMQSNAKSMSEIANQTSQQSTAVSASAEETSVNIQTVASAADELNASIEEINRQISESVRVAAACVTEAEKTGEVMVELSKAADDVGNVVKLIEGIASQVNLLALNATIEAARAGDAGKGFAVVANEVKNLANQVSKAAQDITNQINGIQGQTSHAVETITSITSTIKHVNEISNAIASAVDGQGAATKEISRSIQETSDGTKQVTKNISGVMRSAEETGAASDVLLKTASHLAEESDKLRHVVDTFISHVREG